MKVTRRGLFGLVAGAVGVALLGKREREPHVYATTYTPSSNIVSLTTDVHDLGPVRNFGFNQPAGFQSTAVTSTASHVTLTKFTVANEANDG